MGSGQGQEICGSRVARGQEADCETREAGYEARDEFESESSFESEAEYFESDNHDQDISFTDINGSGSSTCRSDLYCGLDEPGLEEDYGEECERIIWNKEGEGWQRWRQRQKPDTGYVTHDQRGEDRYVSAARPRLEELPNDPEQLESLIEGIEQNEDTPSEVSESSNAEKERIEIRNKSKKVKVTLYNTRSLYDDFRREWFDAMLEDVDSDVIGITESRLLKRVHPGTVNFTNYEVAARTDRVAKHPGGGTCILVRRGLSYHNVHTKSVNFSCQLSSIQIGDTYVIVVYRRPQTTSRQDRQLTEYILAKYGGKRIVLLGDMNLPHLKIKERNVEPHLPEEATADEESSMDLWIELIHGLDLQQQVQDETHDHGNILDLVLCRDSEGIILETPIVDKDLFASMSDHYPITFCLNIQSLYIKQKKVIWDYRNMDYGRFREILSSQNLLERIQNAPTANIKWAIFRDAILEARKLTCPVKVIKDVSRPKWSNGKIRSMKNKINQLRKKLKKGQNSQAMRERRRQALKECNQQLKVLVKEARLDNDHKLLDRMEVDKKALYDHVKKTRRGGFNSPPISNPNETPLITDKAKAEAFQDKFMGIFQDYRYERQEWDMQSRINELNVSPGKLKKRMGKMRRNSAPGIDTIGPLLYKESPFVIFEALSHIYRHCLDNDEIPFDWTIVKVTPLWKGNGSRSDIAKYRPVSLGITAWKLFEAIYLDEINDACESLNAYGSAQHGFRSKRSTITNLTAYWDHITRAIDGNQRVHVLNLDMSSAFDTVNIDVILKNLARIGLGGTPGRLMEAWLKNRFQFVEINGHRSRLCKVNSGIQQGSLTGPALFNLATSKLTHDLEQMGVMCYKYADDIKCIFTCDNDYQFLQVQTAIDAMVAAASEAGLRFNASKSTLMSFGKKKEPFEFDLVINENTIPRVSETKDLGVIFQNNLNFGSTLTENLKKALTIVHIVRSSIKIRSYSLLNKIYNCYFLPILTYGSEVFTSEKAAIRSTMYRGYRAFWRLGGGKLKFEDDFIDPYQACVIKELMFFKRIQFGQTCLNFTDLFVFNDNEGMRAHEKKDLKVIRAQKCPRRNFFSNVCTRWFNQLDPETRNTTNIVKFKEEVIRFIKDKYPTPNYDLSPRFIPER